jgi:hypothetical protein
MHTTPILLYEEAEFNLTPSCLSRKGRNKIVIYENKSTYLVKYKAVAERGRCGSFFQRKEG